MIAFYELCLYCKYITANTKQMLKDHFQRSTATLNNLRSEHFKVSEYLNKGRYRLKQKFFGKGKKHYDFDINSQQFFHQYIDDIIFEPTQIQETFYNEINKALELPISFNNKTKIKDSRIGTRKNPSEVRAILARHFHNRAADLTYKKYRTLLRVHNLNEQQHLPAVKSRTNLIDRQIQQCLSRESRLQIQDYFQASYTQGGKPIPVNENGQPIYKYLDEEDCWFSNIARDDIQSYLRNLLFREDILQDAYWPYWYQFKYIVFSQGLELCTRVEQRINDYQQKVKKQVISNAKLLIFHLQRGLEQISPGNLIQKQNLNNFIYGITGILAQNPVCIPLYPGIELQLVQNYLKLLPTFFKQINLTNQRNIIELIPKLNSFCSIMFKYQNQQILQGQKQIKLGLEDQVDIKKQLITMLEEQWVHDHVLLDFNRFQYKCFLKPLDWEIDQFAKKLELEVRRKNQYRYQVDFGLEELVKTMRLTTYPDFRKIMKKRSQRTIQRIQRKYQDMQLAQKYNKIPDSQINKQRLTQFYKSNTSELIQPITLMKENTRKFFTMIMKGHMIKNPVEIQICQTLTAIKIRELRTKVMNILNGLRCYHREIDLDLRVVCGEEFRFELDDQFLINSNKQTIEKFEKNVKQNETTMSKANSHPGIPSLQNQDFLVKSKSQKPMLYKKDKIERQYFNQQIPHIMVYDGKRKKPIMYQIVLQDLKLVEERILQIGTHFINKYQRYVKMKQLPELVDRVAVLAELFQLEERYLYEKFNLVQAYYYVYENTVQPVNAHKIGKIIVNILYDRPVVDFSADYFKNSYQTLIQKMKQQIKVVKLFTKMIENEQKEHNKVFHKRFAKMCQIPLTLWAYVYGDMQVKGAKTYNKLQRMNSVSSKMSRNSKSQKEKNVLDGLREQIREEFGEDSQQQQGIQEQQFDIQAYDQYMLKRNMDDIFQDIVSGGDAPKDPKEKEGLGVSSLGLQNLTVNPKFEGGPHALHNYLPDVRVTSEQSQKLLNFSQQICWVSNIHDLIKNLSKEGKERYGYWSTEYHLHLQLQICRIMHKILLTPPQLPQKLHKFQTDDPYHQTTTSDMKYFEQIMTPILDLPSALQLSIPATHEKHQNTLPSIDTLQFFDFNILVNLIRFEKPINSAIYRELNLSINLVEFVRMKGRLWHLQLEREQVFMAYRMLGAYCDIPVDKYAHCYGRTGLSEIFMSCSQSKIYTPTFLKHPTLPFSIQQFRNFYQLEQTQLNLFRAVVDLSKYQLEDYIRLSWDIEKPMKNCLLKRENFLLSLDKKNVKMVANRVKGIASSIAGQIFKAKSYLKFKLKLRNQLEDKIRIAHEANIEQLISKYFLNSDSKKYNQNCFTILTQKIKKLITMSYITTYTKDISQNGTNVSTFIELIKTVSNLRNYAVSLPYLSKILIMPTQFQIVAKKAFYDQKKTKIVEQDHQNGHNNVYYVESVEQLIQQWEAITNKTSCNFLDAGLDIQGFIKQLQPPKQKDHLFKWMFQIPSNKISDSDKDALKHLLRVYEPFTGKISVSEYRSKPTPEGSRNKFTQLLDKYTILLEYIESNLMLICLQTDTNVIDTLFQSIDCKIDFQEKYPLADQAAIYQTSPKDGTVEAQYLKDSPMNLLFVNQSRKQQFQTNLKQRMDARQYRPQRRYFAVGDQILDFLTAKVEGYGVIRHCMLQLRDQLALFGKVKNEIAINYMKSKTSNIMNIIWLSLWRTLKTKKDKFLNSYIPQFLDLIVQLPKLQIFQSPGNKNSKRGITQTIPSNLQQLQHEKIKYEKGIYNLKNDWLQNKLKIVFNFLPLNLNKMMEEYVYNSENQGKIGFELYKVRHNWNFVEQFRDLIKRPGDHFRFCLFAKIREFFQLGRDYLLTKVQRPDALQLLQLQQKKITYFQFLIQGKIHMTALSAFKVAKYANSFPENQQKFWDNFNETLQTNRQIVDINTFNIYDQLEAYQNSGKIIFSKSEQSLIINKVKSQESIEENNKIIRTVIFNKLMAEQFKTEVLEVATRLLRAEKTPKTEGKKIQNTSLIPRVHLISSFSSPLIIQRKTYISQQYKLAFVQAFINRFRNKVSRVDLLSSGYGFVITVPDLQDCVNYMNKLLFTFTEKQFKARLDTFSQYYQILIDGIRSRNLMINQQKAIIKHLQDKVKNTLQAQYLAKVSKLLQEKVLIEQKLSLAEQTSNGLEHRVRKAVQHQYDLKITALQKENEQIRAKFEQFKDLLIKLTKDSTKNNFLSLVNILKDQTSSLLDKKVDLSQSFKAIAESGAEKNKKKIVVRQQQTKQKEIQMNQEYGQEDIQKCKIGQDIIHDPYYVTKLINKMRIFNLFKMGAKRIKHEAVDQKRVHELTSLHKIQDRIVAQTERQTVLRNQLIKAQEQLSKKSVQLDKTRHTIQTLQNQKAKLKILLVTKEKKIEQKQRENEEIKKKIEEKPETLKIESKQSIEGIQKQRPGQEEQLPRISALRQHKKSVRKVAKQPFITNLQEKSGSLSLYEKFELSNKDSTWRQKCEQLYLQNKKLLNEVQKLKQGFSGTATPMTRQGYSLNMRNKRSAEQSEKDSSRTEKRKFTNLSFKYGVMKG